LQHYAKMIFLFVVLAFLVPEAGAAAAKTSKSVSPETVANNFYKYHFSHDMGFTPETVKSRSNWLTPELIEACRLYFAVPEDPEEPPYIEGDPFSGSQEYPNRFSLGASTTSGLSAKVPVTFTWKEDGHSTKGTVVLKYLQGKWLIDDVEFLDQESVRKLLSDALKPPEE
jgi:Protein of unknown function (DUF3828)